MPVGHRRSPVSEPKKQMTQGSDNKLVLIVDDTPTNRWGHFLSAEGFVQEESCLQRREGLGARNGREPTWGSKLSALGQKRPSDLVDAVRLLR